MTSVVSHWTKNVEEFRRSPESFLAARNITAHSFVLDILEVNLTETKSVNISRQPICACISLILSLINKQRAGKEMPKWTNKNKILCKAVRNVHCTQKCPRYPGISNSHFLEQVFKIGIVGGGGGNRGGRGSTSHPVDPCDQ